jgi:biotin transport system permease protein
MKENTTPWAYRKGSSLIHRLPAGAKLGFLLTLSIASFFPGTWPFNVFIPLAIIFILIGLSLAAGIRPHELLRGSGPLLLVVLGVFLFQGIEFSPLGFNTEGLKESIIFCIRIIAAYSAGALLFSVSTSGEIKKSLSKLEALLRLEKLNLSLYISLMLGFLPRFFEIWEDLNLAWKSRGGKNNLSRMLTLVPILIERMMRKALETAEAMEARGLVFNSPP